MHSALWKDFGSQHSLLTLGMHMANSTVADRTGQASHTGTGTRFPSQAVDAQLLMQSDLGVHISWCLPGQKNLIQKGKAHSLGKMVI